MNFNYGYNFNLKSTKIEQQKPDTKGQGEEVKEEEQASPKAAPETVVLTGDAADIQAAIAKATVRGAMGANAVGQLGGDDKGFGDRLAEYIQMRQSYLNQLQMLTPEGRKNYLLTLQTKIEGIINFLYDPNSTMSPQNLTWNASWPITSLNELYEDYNNWANEMIEVNNWIYNHGQTQTHGPIEDMFISLEENYHALNPNFVYDIIKPGIGRVNYFRGKVHEYQEAINKMNATVQRFIEEFGYAAFSQYAQEFDQKLAEFQERLVVAQNYLNRALHDLPSKDDILNNPEQSQTAR